MNFSKKIEVDSGKAQLYNKNIRNERGYTYEYENNMDIAVCFGIGDDSFCPSISRYISDVPQLVISGGILAVISGIGLIFEMYIKK